MAGPIYLSACHSKHVPAFPPYFSDYYSRWHKNSQGINRFVIIDNDIWATRCPPADCLWGDMWGIWDSKGTVCQLDCHMINMVQLTFASIDRFSPIASHFIPNNDHVHSMIFCIWRPCDLNSSLQLVLSIQYNGSIAHKKYCTSCMEPGPFLYIKIVFPGMGISIIKITWSWDLFYRNSYTGKTIPLYCQSPDGILTVRPYTYQA